MEYESVGAANDSLHTKGSEIVSRPSDEHRFVQC